MKNKIKLSEFEREDQKLLEDIKKLAWEPVSNFEEEKKRYEAIAHNTFNKTKRVNLHLSERDFRAAQVKAMVEGLPYQTLLSSIVHKYLSGALVSKENNL